MVFCAEAVGMSMNAGNNVVDTRRLISRRARSVFGKDMQSQPQVTVTIYPGCFYINVC